MVQRWCYHCGGALLPGHGGAATCWEASHEIFFATIVVLFLHHMKIFLLRSYNMIFFLLQLFCDFATIV